LNSRPSSSSLELEALFQREQDLADAEQPDDRHQEVEPAQQVRGAERQAQGSGHRVEPDGGQREAGHHRRQRLERGLLAHADEGAESEQVDGEELRRPEFEREIGDDRREERYDQHRDEGADERGGKCGGQRRPGPSLLRERIAVEGGGDGPRLARNVEQDGSYRAAEQRAPVDAREQNDRGGLPVRGLRHREGQRQQDGDAIGAAESRQHADDDAQDHADEHEKQVVPCHRHGEAVHQRLNFVHEPSVSSGRARFPPVPWEGERGTSARR
jgi:hypothetical protein